MTDRTVRAGLACWLGVCVAMGLGGAVGCAEADRDSYLLATATQGGTYYPVGSAIANTASRALAERGVALSATTSAGSEENLILLRDRQVQFAILQGLYGAWAWHGEGPLEAEGPHRELRSICMLWPNVEHFVIRAEHAETGTIADIERLGGARFSIGSRNSGTEGSGRHILGAVGIDPDGALDLVYRGYDASAESLQNGTIRGMNTPAGVPVAAVTRAFAAMGGQLAILAFTDEQLAQVNARYAGLWTPYTIPEGTYPHQDAPVRTIAQPNFLAVRADVDEEHVYQITRAVFENLAEVRRSHAAARVIALETALDGLPFPLHPGALRYFEEAGLDVPERLRPAAPVEAP